MTMCWHVYEGNSTLRTILSQVGRDESSHPQSMLGLKRDEEADPEMEATPCYLSSRPRASLHAHRYGGTAHSWQEYTHLPPSLSERYEHRTLSSVIP